MFVQPRPPCEAEVAETTDKRTMEESDCKKGTCASDGRGKTLNMGASRVQRLAELD